MLDFSDKLRPTPAPAEAAPVTLPPIGIPSKGTRVRHFQGALYTVEGACFLTESKEIGVMFRPVDPQEGDELHVSPSASLFGFAEGGQARFSRLRDTDRTCLRAHLSADLMADSVLESVLRSYDESWRFFHNRDHIYGLFELATKKGMKLSPEQALAVLFHDVIYVPGASEGQNERQSTLAMLGFKHLVRQEGIDWALVSKIIEDTATHKASVPESVAVQDLDLSSLGDDPLHFCAGNELVWLENRHLLPAVDARKDFDTRRLRFLLALAERGPIFSEAFSDYESAARENLEGLRKAWVQRYGPR